MKTCGLNTEERNWCHRPAWEKRDQAPFVIYWISEWGQGMDFKWQSILSYKFQNTSRQWHWNKFSPELPLVFQMVFLDTIEDTKGRSSLSPIRKGSQARRPFQAIVQWPAQDISSSLSIPGCNTRTGGHPVAQNWNPVFTNDQQTTEYKGYKMTTMMTLHLCWALVVYSFLPDTHWTFKYSQYQLMKTAA